MPFTAIARLLLNKLTLPFLSQYQQKQAEKLGLLFRETNEEWVAGIAAGASVAQSKLQILLHRLHQIEQPDWNLAESGAFAAFEQIKKHLEGSYRENLRIERLAKEYSISASYLRKLFLKYTGMGPKEYLNHLRNQQACGYLRFTDYKKAFSIVLLCRI